MISEAAREEKTTFPRSVQPGIPRLNPPKSGWTTYRLGDLVESVQRPIKLNDDEIYDLVTVKRSRGGVESRGQLLGSQISVKTQFKLQAADFLISKRQIVHGACGIVPDAQHDAIVSNEYSILRCKPALDLNFLNYLSHTIYFQQICFHSSIGVHVEKMIFKLDEWLKWPINIPTLPEQQKIADFLSSVDAKIDAVKRKLNALERYKKGLMQQIFSQKIRFKQDDGSDFPEWEEKRLGDITKTFSGGTPSVGNPNFYNGAIPFIKSGEISFCEVADTITELGLQKSSAKMVNKGDLLYALYGANSGETAIAQISGAINQAILCIQSNQNIYYLYSFLLKSKEIIRKTYLQGGQGNLSAEIVKSIMIPLPSLPEQQKIADFLSSVDAKIDAIKSQVEKLEAFKKGLLQQMFV